MKKLLVTGMIMCFVTAIFAQSDKYVNAMKTNIASLDSMMMKGNGAELANNFDRIGDAEKTQWLPYYYASYCTITSAYRETDLSKKDAIADKAKAFLDKAVAILGKENSETYVIRAMIATTHMTVDPQSRYMTYGAEIKEDLEKSISLDAKNPRPVLTQAENIFYTPEGFGGGKDVAKPMFNKASAMFDSFKPETELSPSWGKSALGYFLSQYK
ncbi:MAG: hypothetical protein ABIY62_01840 [Ginsengibacter sp.]